MRQPPPGTKIDWSHPIVKNSKILVPGNGPSGVVYEEGNKLIREIGSTVTREVNKFGMVGKYGAVSTDHWVPAPTYKFPNSATAPCTVFWIAKWGGTDFVGPWQIGVEGAGLYDAMRLSYTASASYEPISFINFAQGTSVRRPTGGFSATDFQKPHAAVFRFQGDWTSADNVGFDFWSNGKRASSWTYVPSATGAGDNEDNKIGMSGSTDSYFDGQIGTFVFVAEALSDSICKSWSENPYQIFKQKMVMPVGPYVPGPPVFDINIVSDDNSVDSNENPWSITGSEMGDQ